MIHVGKTMPCLPPTWEWFILKKIYKNADDWGMVNMALGITHTTEDPIPTSLYSQTFFRASGPTCSCSLAATWNDLLRVSEADTDCLNVEGKDSARLVASSQNQKFKQNNFWDYMSKHTCTDQKPFLILIHKNHAPERASALPLYSIWPSTQWPASEDAGSFVGGRSLV